MIVVIPMPQPHRGHLPAVAAGRSPNRAFPMYKPPLIPGKPKSLRAMRHWAAKRLAAWGGSWGTLGGSLTIGAAWPLVGYRRPEATSAEPPATATDPPCIV